LLVVAVELTLVTQTLLVRLAVLVEEAQNTLEHGLAALEPPIKGSLVRLVFQAIEPAVEAVLVEPVR
jgi:hypothetical protein